MSMIRLGVVIAVVASGVNISHGVANETSGKSDEKLNANWHEFRGPLATGEAPDAKPPIEWGVDSNIRWKTEIDGVGSSTPIIWGDKVFVLTAVETEKVDESKPDPEDQPDRPFGITYPNRFYKYNVVCVDRTSGDVLWQKTALEAVPAEGTHPDNDFASATPTTDGERLYVSFGSQGFYCYDLDGNLIWERDLGDVETRLSFGEGASLKVYGDRLIVVRDQEGQSIIQVLDSKTGETKWEQERDEPSCWATPIVIEFGGLTQVITNGSNRVRSYDLENGELIWECGGQVANVTPSPVVEDGAVICMSGYRGYAAVAIDLASKGDVTDTDQVKWKLDRSTPYIASPLLYKGRLYFNQSLNGVLTCVDAKSGDVIYGPTRVDDIGRIYASPVAANGYLYFVGRDGTTVVYAADADEFEPVAVNKLEDPIDASPAIVGDTIFLRGRDYLYCIGE